MPPVRDAAAAGCGARRSGRGGASGIYNGRTHVGKFRWFGICAGLARDWNLSDILSRAMADTSAPATLFPGEDASPLASETADPLEGDWSEGLRGPLRAHGIAPPRRLSLEDLAQASTGSTNGAAAPAPEHASAAQLEAPSESAPTPWSEPVASPSLEDDGSASGAVTEWDQAAAPPGPADAVPVAPPADDWQMQAPATDPTASATPAEEQAAPPEAWSAAPQEPVQEWQGGTAPSDWEEGRKAGGAGGPGGPRPPRGLLPPRAPRGPPQRPRP